MPAYFIGEIDVHDADGYAAYAKHTPAIVAKFGGKFVARGGPTMSIEGPAPAGRIVVAEFKTSADANAFYNSPEYQAIVKMRHAVSTGRVFIVEGVA